MLANHPIDPMLLATDLGVAREFYGDRIGLEILIESDDFLTFKCGGDSRLVVTADQGVLARAALARRPSRETTTSLD
jgi:extradiol dioxygenase family protein